MRLPNALENCQIIASTKLNVVEFLISKSQRRCLGDCQSLYGKFSPHRYRSWKRIDLIVTVVSVVRYLAVFYPIKKNSSVSGSNILVSFPHPQNVRVDRFSLINGKLLMVWVTSLRSIIAGEMRIVRQIWSRVFSYSFLFSFSPVKYCR